jgi:hypothetical protein
MAFPASFRTKLLGLAALMKGRAETEDGSHRGPILLTSLASEHLLVECCGWPASFTCQSENLELSPTALVNHVEMRKQRRSSTNPVLRLSCTARSGVSARIKAHGALRVAGTSPWTRGARCSTLSR